MSGSVDAIKRFRVLTTVSATAIWTKSRRGGGRYRVFGGKHLGPPNVPRPAHLSIGN